MFTTINSVLSSPDETDFNSLLAATQKAYVLGEIERYRQWALLLDKMASPRKGEYYLLRAKEALVIQKDSAGAQKWGLKALDSLPKHREVVLLVAGLLLQNGEVKRARQVLTNANLLSGEFEDWLEKTRWLVP